MDRPQLSAGIIGAGIMGMRHAREIASREGFRLASICDMSSQAAKRLADAHGVRSYVDCNEMLRSESLDLVVVATPEWAHWEPFSACMKHRVPAVIVEKPLAVSVEQAERMLKEAKRAGSLVFVNFANRFDPRDMATKWIIDQGWIGTPAYAELRLDDNVVVPQHLWAGRSAEWARQSSPVHFLMSHLIDLSRWYVGYTGVVRVHAVSGQGIVRNSIDRVNAWLTTTSGATLALKSEWSKFMEETVDFDIYIAGTCGSVVYHKLPGPGTQGVWRAQLSEHLDDDEIRQGVETLAELGLPISSACVIRTEVKARKLRSLAVPPIAPQTGLHYLLDGVLENTSSPKRWSPYGRLPVIEDGVIAVRIAEAITRAAETGSVIDVETEGC